MKISKNIKFDCAHMLSNYVGKCANLHGHTYHGTVTLEGKITLKTGMLLDYNRIKEIVDEFDHAIIFSEAKMRNPAETELFDWACRHEMHKVELFIGKSTAENIATTMARTFILVEDSVEHVVVRLSETDGSWAEAEATRCQ